MDKAIIQGNINTNESRAIFNEDIKPFRERIKEGAFKESLQNYGKVPLYFNHERQIASIEDISLCENDLGLTFIANISDIEVISKCIYGSIKGCSFNFVPFEERIIHKELINSRIIEDMILREVSVLDKEPAYPSSINIIYVPDTLRIQAFKYFTC
ncbi:HK97 family phage prohead protease [Ruminiclostridium cellulolyticum]|uniref:Peptidase U35 phage prohead HK97 n=1 Tax=Ruminiclostridium cellulolyticum (strain ATCC 35319 / DSM 5812 / JCM 6584 / H10) TaxID=394503 RepID=B8I344_RUMCH|nr:HK97 family phage prohead protease [Ruminiclostridium cellulolyticum]ACL76187.1 peptidase U35 phage prohead HK97 [Ruminiclostridium cellulolyticum H10]